MRQETNGTMRSCNCIGLYIYETRLGYNNNNNNNEIYRPDMTFAVDWALKTNDLSTYLSDKRVTKCLFQCLVILGCSYQHKMQSRIFNLFHNCA